MLSIQRSYCFETASRAVRLTACQILQVIATKESLPALQEAAKDGNLSVAATAKHAIQTAEKGK